MMQHHRCRPIDTTTAKKGQRGHE